MCSIATIIYIQHDVFYGIFSNFIFFAEKSRILTKFKQKTLSFLGNLSKKQHIPLHELPEMQDFCKFFTKFVSKTCGMICCRFSSFFELLNVTFTLTSRKMQTAVQPEPPHAYKGSGWTCKYFSWIREHKSVSAVRMPEAYSKNPFRDIQ